MLSAGLERMILAYCFCYASTDDNMLALNLKYVPTMLKTNVAVLQKYKVCLASLLFDVLPELLWSMSGVQFEIAAEERLVAEIEVP